MPFLTDEFGNASSIHQWGQKARAAVDRARHQVAGLLSCRPNEIVFTSGGTESDNLAIRGVWEANRSHGSHIVISAIEHPAVANTCQRLEELGASVSVVGVGGDGTVDAKDIADAIRDDTVLVSVMTANNEIGTIQPVSVIGQLVREMRDGGRKIWFHTDAVQAVGKTELNVESLGCDLLSLSGHKIYAPKGVGALFVRRGVRLAGQSLGGHQERGRRGGTENVAFIVALGTAAEIAASEMRRNTEHLSGLCEAFERKVEETVPDLIFNGRKGERLPNISNICFKGIDGEGLLINLDMSGVAVSTGSACSSGSIEPSPVILALGVPEPIARGSVRFSFGKDNTIEEVEYVAGLLPKAVDNLRRLSPSYQSASGA